VTGDIPSTALTQRVAPLLAIIDLRARKAGSMLFVDLTASVPHTITIDQASALDELITRKLKEEKKEIAEVRVKFEPRH
jgi:divalent metal cation (Fe/Co/Zn/Cd) transporter